MAMAKLSGIMFNILSENFVDFGKIFTLLFQMMTAGLCNTVVSQALSSLGFSYQGVANVFYVIISKVS